MLKHALLLLGLSLISAGLCAQESAAARRIRLLRGRAENSNSRIAAGANFELAKMARERRLHPDAATNDAEYPDLLNRAANLGHPKAKLALAEYHLSSKMLRNQQLAFPYLQDLAKIHPSKDFTLREKFKVFYLLGHCYETGKGVRMDTVRAQRFYRLASIGNSDARFIMLRNVNKGKNKEPVYELLYEICLADMEPSDPARVDSFLAQNKLRDAFADYLDRKSLAGDRSATIILADNLFFGGLFPQQMKRALECFKRAVNQGNPEAAMRLAEFHERGQFGLAKDPEIVEKYYLQAFQHSELRIRAATRLAEQTKKRIDALSASPDKDEAALARLKNLYFYYLMISEQYSVARNFIDSDPGQQFNEKDLYLKAKEYHTSGGDPKQYRERIRMAANAGYPLAVIDYISSIDVFRRTPKQSAGLLRAMLEYPEEENPEWLWNVSRLYLAGGRENPEFSAEKSLLYAEKAASRGSTNALEYLIRSYGEGNRSAGIPVDAAKSEKYRQELLAKDILLDKADFFRQFSERLVAKKVRTPDDFTMIFRSLGLSPYADYLYAGFLFQGDPGMNIRKDGEHGMLMLHLSARNGNFRQAVDEIIRRIQSGVKPNRTPDEVLLDQETVSYYQSLL